MTSQTPPSESTPDSLARHGTSAPASTERAGSLPSKSLYERVALCHEQIEESPYSHTIAAGWYAEDVTRLLEQLEAAQRVIDAARAEYDNSQLINDEAIELGDALSTYDALSNPASSPGGAVTPAGSQGSNQDSRPLRGPDCR